MERILQYCKVTDEEDEGQRRDLSMSCVGMEWNVDRGKKALGETPWGKSILNWEKKMTLLPSLREENLAFFNTAARLRT